MKYCPECPTPSGCRVTTRCARTPALLAPRAEDATAETATRRSPDEFRAAAIERGITSWLNHECSLCGYPCGYPCGYLFFRDPEYDVLYDAGCNCVTWPDAPRESSWGEVAQQYNMQSHPDVIARYAAFWGFA